MKNALQFCPILIIGVLSSIYFPAESLNRRWFYQPRDTKAPSTIHAAPKQTFHWKTMCLICPANGVSGRLLPEKSSPCPAVASPEEGCKETPGCSLQYGNLERHTLPPLTLAGGAWMEFVTILEVYTLEYPPGPLIQVFLLLNQRHWGKWYKYFFCY